MDPERVRTYWRWFFVAAALEAGAAVLALARVPSEGLSFARSALFAVLTGFALLGGYLAVRQPPWLDSLGRPSIITSSALLAVCLGSALFLLRYLDPVRLLPFYERLSPLLVFLLLVSLQAFFFLLALRNGIHLDELASRRGIWVPALIFYAFLLLVWLLVSVTRLGLTPDPAYWGEPGVPVQGWQFALALLGGVAVLALSMRDDASGITRPATLFPLILYLLAAAIWLSVPTDVLRNSFYVSIDPPTDQPFPYSDAGYYDTMAQSLFIGHPYRGEIPTRPLYIVLLAGLHAVFGQHYELIAAGQTLILALIPVILYLLGEKIHSRVAGVIAALFLIFRELTTLLISSETRVSNTRTLLVDLPTMLLVLVVCLLALRWLERRDAKSALIAGGGMALLLLLRTQSLLLIPVLLVMAAIVFGLRTKRFCLLSGFFLLGLLIALAPWLLHNYLQTGRVALDAAFQYKIIATQYAYTGNLDTANFDFAGKSLGQILLQFLLKDPGFVFGFIANHFLAGWVGGLLALPLIQTYNGIFAPINLYWLNWDGSLAWYNVVLVGVYLAVIALGLGASWRRWRWIGLLPLAFNTGYSLATAIGRFSGWRYDLPVDWVPYFYFAAGFAEILGLLTLLFGSDAPAAYPGARENSDTPPDASTKSALSLRGLVPPALLFALIGGLPWFVTVFAGPRYLDQSLAGLAAKLGTIRGVPESEQVDAFLAQPDAVLIEGRLLYPRYFSRNRGMSSSNSWPAYATRDYPREGFLLLNQGRIDARFPTQDVLDFPQAADAILLGCQREDYVEVRLIAFPESRASYMSSSLSEPCAAKP